MTTRYEILSPLRGSAALWVVFNHALLIFLSRTPGVTGYDWFTNSCIGVQAFFVISGYCIVNSAFSVLQGKRTTAQFIRSRITRIFPAYFAVVFLTIIICVALYHASSVLSAHHSVIAQQNFLHRGMLFYLGVLTALSLPLQQEPISAQFWTLSYELTFYLIVSGLIYLTAQAAKQPERILLSLLHGITVASTLGLVLAPEYVPFPLEWWPLFGLGVIVFDLVNSPTRRPAWCALWVTALLILFLEYRYLALPEAAASRGAVHPGLGLLLAILLIVAYPHDKTLMRCKIARLFTAISPLSYSLYLTHMLSLGAVAQIFRTLTGTGALGSGVLLISSQLGGSLLVAYLFYWLIEKPLRNVDVLASLDRYRRRTANGVIPVLPVWKTLENKT